jgi:hypothetical protein
MAMNMDALLKITARVDGADNIGTLNRGLQGLQGQAKNAALGFNNLKGAVAGFGAAIAGSAIVAGLGAVIKKSIDAGDELFNLQAKTGVAASALIGIGNAAKLADVDVGTLGKGLTKLNVNLVKAAEGNEDLARKFKALGVDVKDANGQVVPADKALKQIADRFADMPDGAQKAAAAVALFGKAGADLIPLLNEGAASMEKFTYKVGEDFAARSDLFNDTITELGIKTQGFGMELTDALLPALQSILEVFADLFDTKQDWTALFLVIKVGIQSIAAVVFATIKLVDVLIKATVYSFDAIGKALQGDFSGAGQALSKGFNSGIEQAKKDFAQLGKIFTDAPSPGTGRRTGGRSLAVDTSAADTAGAAAARKAAADGKRAASEQERILEKRAALTEKSINLEEQLRRSVEDTRDAFDVVGASPTQKLYFERDTALTENKRNVDDFKKNIKSISDEAVTLGAKFDPKILNGFIDQLERANTELTDQKYLQGLKDLLPSVDEYNAKIAEVTRGKTELTELEKLNAQVNLLQLDILAATNPALAEHVRLLRERAGALDAATAKQKTDNESIGAGIKDRLQEYYNSIKDIGGAIGDAVVGSLKGLEDQLTAFVTTGKASFNDLATSIIEDLSRIVIRAAIIKPITEAIGSLFPGFKFANGGIMTGDGPMPLKKYASGGIANSPQLALYGEGSRPEAFVPLPDGRRIPVAMQGGGGGSTNVTVNVDASGNASVQGDQAQAKQLGVAVSAAVQAELVKQQRPGGILAGTRR